MKVSVFYRRSPKAKAPGVGALYVVLVILAFVAVAYIAAVKRAEQQRATAEGSAAMPALQAPAGQAGQASGLRGTLWQRCRRGAVPPPRPR